MVGNGCRSDEGHWQRWIPPFKMCDSLSDQFLLCLTKGAKMNPSPALSLAPQHLRHQGYFMYPCPTALGEVPLQTTAPFGSPLGTPGFFDHIPKVPIRSLSALFVPGKAEPII